MARNAPVSRNHPLIGTWETEEEDSSAIFTIRVKDGKFIVTGIDDRDNEAFEISDVSWSGRVLCFTTLMPSTQYRARHVFHLPKAGRLTHELTLYEVWKKRQERK